MNTTAFRLRIPTPRVEFDILHISFLLLVAAFCWSFLVGCDRDDLPSGATACNGRRLPGIEVPVILCRQDEKSVMSSNQVALSVSPDQRYPIRGFVAAPVGGTLCAFAAKDLVGKTMPGIFNELDLWVPFTKNGDILMRYLPDGLLGYEHPIVRPMKGNRVLHIRMPVMRQHLNDAGASEWHVVVSEIELKPDEQGQGFQSKLEEDGQGYYQYLAISKDSPAQFVPSKQWIGNGVYKKGAKIKVKTGPNSGRKMPVDVLMGIVTDCTISATATQPPETKAIVRIVPLPAEDNAALEEVLDVGIPTQEIVRPSAESAAANPRVSLPQVE